MSATLLSLAERQIKTEPVTRRRPAGEHQRRKPMPAELVDEPRPRIRPFVRRWMTALLLLVAASLAVLYVSNAIAINSLLSSIISLERERDMITGENERLRAELLGLMSVQRVTDFASDELHMVQPEQPPVALAPSGE